MPSIEKFSVWADLTALTRDGLLQAHLSRADLWSRIEVGSRGRVLDMAGGEGSYSASVVSVGEDGTLLLAVDWDEYDVVLMDPPWKYYGSSTKNR